MTSTTAIVWSPEDYYRHINQAQLNGCHHLADVLLLLLRKDYPAESPARVLSPEGTRPCFYALAHQAGKRAVRASTVPGSPL